MNDEKPSISKQIIKKRWKKSSAVLRWRIVEQACSRAFQNYLQNWRIYWKGRERYPCAVRMAIVEALLPYSQRHFRFLHCWFVVELHSWLLLSVVYCDLFCSLSKWSIVVNQYFVSDEVWSCVSSSHKFITSLEIITTFAPGELSVFHYFGETRTGSRAILVAFWHVSGELSVVGLNSFFSHFLFLTPTVEQSCFSRSRGEILRWCFVLCNVCPMECLYGYDSCFHSCWCQTHRTDRIVEYCNR